MEEEEVRGERERMRHLSGRVGLHGAGIGSPDGGLEIYGLVYTLCVLISFPSTLDLVFNMFIISDFAYGLLPGQASRGCSSG